jgi:hypothetical protein
MVVTGTLKGEKMRNDKRFDLQYIVNVTNQLVGASTLSKLSSDWRSSYPDALYLYLGPRISEKLKKMNPETLGLICEFGCSKNFSQPLARTTNFIRMTGLADVCPHDLKPTTGRELLEEIALRTIVAVAVDIARQRGYEAIRDRETEDEELFDRGMRDYIHHGSPDIKVPMPTLAELREYNEE